MVITVRFPFRISATCEALLVSLAPLPATKKPQNACAAGAGESAPSATAIATLPGRSRLVIVVPSSSVRDRTGAPPRPIFAPRRGGRNGGRNGGRSTARVGG